MSEKKPPAILVTGANGQLGSELKFLAEKTPNSFLFTDVDELDITDSYAVKLFFEKFNPAYCINCAAYTAVDKAENDEEIARLVNISAVKNLAEACQSSGSVFVHISTDFVFKGQNVLPLNVDDATEPLGVYGKTKLEGEKVALDLCDKTIVIRTSWLYSSFGNNFVKTMLRLVSSRHEIGVVYDQTGTPTYARDLAAAIIKIIGMCEKEIRDDQFGIYHYSNEGVASWYDFAKAIFEIKGLDMAVKPLRTEEYPLPARRPSYSVLDKSRIKKEFGLEIPYWRDSLVDCLEQL